MTRLQQRENLLTRQPCEEARARASNLLPRKQGLRDIYGMGARWSEMWREVIGGEAIDDLRKRSQTPRLFIGRMFKKWWR